MANEGFKIKAVDKKLQIVGGPTDAGLAQAASQNHAGMNALDELARRVNFQAKDEAGVSYALSARVTSLSTADANGRQYRLEGFIMDPNNKDVEYAFEANYNVDSHTGALRLLQANAADVT